MIDERTMRGRREGGKWAIADAEANGKGVLGHSGLLRTVNKSS